MFIQVPTQCFNYKVLTSSKRKFDLGKLILAEQVQCDKIPGRSDHSGTSSDWNGPGWYRVVGQAGTQLSEKSYIYNAQTVNGITMYPCNTAAGGWLTGGHPRDLGDTVTRAVCFKNDCYGSYKITIEVTKCNGYFVYNLKEVPYCSRGYCTQ